MLSYAPAKFLGAMTRQFKRLAETHLQAFSLKFTLHRIFAARSARICYATATWFLVAPPYPDHPSQASHPAVPPVAPFAPCRRRHCRNRRRPRRHRRPPGHAGRATTESPAGHAPRDGEPTSIASPASPAKLQEILNGLMDDELISFEWILIERILV